LLQAALYLWTTLLPVSSTRSGQLATALRSWYPGGTDPGHVVIHLHRTRCRSPQVRVANCLCTNAAFTLSTEPVGFAVMCQLASALWAFYAVSVRRLAHLHSGFLQTNPRGSALAVS
jgi:hypothetical protein